MKWRTGPGGILAGFGAAAAFSIVAFSDVSQQ